MIQSFRDERAKNLTTSRRVRELVGIEDQARTRLRRLDAAKSLADLRAIRGNHEKDNTASGLTISIESASSGERKDQRMSKSSITTKQSKRIETLPPIHPGRILIEDLRDEDVSINALARAIRVPANRISLIVNQKRSITADTAARLARFFGTSAQYWLNLQNLYDLESLDQSAIERDVIPKHRAA